MKRAWLSLGKISDPSVWREIGFKDVQVGDEEWQLSDGPIGERSSSADFLTAEEVCLYISKNNIRRITFEYD